MIEQIFTQLQSLNPNTLLGIAAMGGLLYFFQSFILTIFKGIKAIFAKIFLRKLQIHYSHDTSHKFNLWFSANHKRAKFNRDFKTQRMGNVEDVIPGYKNSFFFIKGLPIFYVSRVKEEKKNAHEETDIINITVVSIFPSALDKIYNLFKDIDIDSQGGENCVKIYKQESDGYYWVELGEVRKVLQPPNQSVRILEDDIKRFEELKETYESKGLAHKRGYCLYGEPGTGKTSIVLHLAHKFKKNVYILEKHSTELDSLLTQIKPGSIILVEDIDLSPLAGSKRTLSEPDDTGEDNNSEATHRLAPIVSNGTLQYRMKQVNKSEQKSSGWTTSDSLRKTLNLLDGVYSYRDSIFICTTNQKESLDDALLRPGRIDQQVYITKLTPKEQLEFYNTFYGLDEKHIFTTNSYNISTYADILKQNMTCPASAKKYILEMDGKI